MIDIAKEVILVSDSSKFNRKSLAHICAPSKIDVIITDEGLSPADQKQLEDSGIRVLIA